MAKFNTIHVFGFGDTQIIGEKNGTVKADTLTKLTAFIDHVKTFKPTDVTLTDHHVIHVFEDREVRYLGRAAEDKKAKTSFSVKIADVDSTILTEFVDELSAAVPVEQ